MDSIKRMRAELERWGLSLCRRCLAERTHWQRYVCRGCEIEMKGRKRREEREWLEGLGTSMSSIGQEHRRLR